MLSKQIFLLFQLTACAYVLVLTYPDAAAHDFPDRKVTKSSSIQAKKVLGNMTKGEPGIARARLPARPRAENRAIWQNQVPVARTSVTGHARARPLPGL